jgi:hypothetical protein
MNNSPAEEGVATSTAAEEVQETERKSNAATTVKQKLDSLVIGFDMNNNVVLPPEDDGTFDLDVSPQGDVKGTHVHPTSDGVKGSLKNDVLDVTSDDGAMRHTGVLIANKFYIGKRIILDEALTDQEEGVWVGTKKP